MAKRDRAALAVVVGVLFGCEGLWETGLVHRWDVVGVLLQVLVVAGCVVLWWFVLGWVGRLVDR